MPDKELLCRIYEAFLHYQFKKDKQKERKWALEKKIQNRPIITGKKRSVSLVIKKLQVTTQNTNSHVLEKLKFKTDNAKC